MAFDWAGAYLAAQPGQTIVVPAGTYTNVRIPFRSDLLGKGNVQDPSTLITFDVPDPIVCNGEFDIVGSCVRIKGRTSPYGVGATIKVNSSLHPIADSSSQYPTNVVVEGADVVTLGCYSAQNVVFRDIDVGPASITSNGGSCFTEEGGGIDENKLSQRSGPVPTGILYERVNFHDQNSKNRQGRESGDFGGGCHWGGFFLVNGDGIRFYRCKWECNVVYNVQVQNFAGPASRNVTFEECAFGLPAEWAYVTPCSPNGQDSIQFSGSGQYVGFLIKNCAIAGPADKMIGYYGGGSVPPDFANIVVQGTISGAASSKAPPVPGGGTPPPPPPPTGMDLRKLSETASSITLEWNPVAGATGYRFTAEKQAKPSHTWDPSRTTVRFAKGSAWYKVEALAVSESDEYRP